MCTQSTSVTDRQTDGQTDRITITDTVQRIASHGKKATPCHTYKFPRASIKFQEISRISGISKSCRHPVLSASQHTQVIGSVTTLQFSSNSPNFPRLFQVFLPEALMAIKPPQVHRCVMCVLLSEHGSIYYHILLYFSGTSGSPACACQLYLSVLWLCLFCEHCN